MRKLYLIITLLVIITPNFAHAVVQQSVTGSQPPLTTEADPKAGAVTGIVKSDGAGNFSAATANVDYEPAFAYGTAAGEINTDDIPEGSANKYYPGYVFGTGAGDIAEGDHDHSGVYEPAFVYGTAAGEINTDDIPEGSANKYYPGYVFGTGAGDMLEGDTTPSDIGAAAALGADDNYVTDAEKVVIGNTSGTNTGDNPGYDSYDDIPVASPSNGDITHFATADQIYDWAVGLFLQSESQTIADLDDANHNLPGITQHWRGTVILPNAIYAEDHEICIIPATSAALTVTKIQITCDADPATELDIDLKFCDAFIGQANTTTIDACDTTSGTFSATTGFNDATVPSGKCPMWVFGAEPDENITQFSFDITWDYD